MITTYDATTPEGQARHASFQQRDAARIAQIEADRKRFGRVLNVFRGVGLGLPAAAIAGPAVAGMFAGGGGAAAGGAAAASGGGYGSLFSGTGQFLAPVSGAVTGGGAATAGAGGMTFGNLLRLGEMGAGLFGSIAGQRSQNRSLDRDSAMRSQEFAAQMAMLQQQNEQAKRQWEAQEAQRAQEFALTMEDRNRRVRLEDEREARRAPYREMAAQARLRLGDLLRLGRG